jgi:hypothetical protein
MQIGAVINAVITVPKTSNWQTTAKVSTKMKLVAGQQVLKFYVHAKPSFNLDKIVISIFTTSINSASKETNNYILYPNPASEYLNISNNNLETSIGNIIDTKGAIVTSIKIKNGENTFVERFARLVFCSN